MPKFKVVGKDTEIPEPNRSLEVHYSGDSGCPVIDLYEGDFEAYEDEEGLLTVYHTEQQEGKQIRVATTYCYGEVKKVVSREWHEEK